MVIIYKTHLKPCYIVVYADAHGVWYIRADSKMGQLWDNFSYFIKHLQITFDYIYIYIIRLVY